MGYLVHGNVRSDRLQQDMKTWNAYVIASSESEAAMVSEFARAMVRGFTTEPGAFRVHVEKTDDAHALDANCPFKE